MAFIICRSPAMTAAPKDLLSLLDDVAAALQSLEDFKVTVNFDDKDPHSVEAAIQAVEAAIDARVAAYRGNELIESAVAELKAECRAGILEQPADFTDDADDAPDAARPSSKRTLH
jgi:hypothetical protein